MKMEKKDLTVSSRYLNLQKSLDSIVTKTDEDLKVKMSDTAESILFLKENKLSLLKLCNASKDPYYKTIFIYLSKSFPSANKNKIRLALITNFIFPSQIKAFFIVLLMILPLLAFCFQAFVGICLGILIGLGILYICCLIAKSLVGRK